MGLTAYFANSWMASQRAALEEQAPAAQAPGVETADVLIAKADMATGSFIRPDDLEWRAWPKVGVVDDYLVLGEATEEELAGAVARTRLFAGEPITRSRVVHKGDQGFLAAVLDPSHRAVSIPVDAVSGIAGFIFPGDMVDVLLTFNRTVQNEGSDDSSTRYFSETLLNRVRVLAIDQTVDSGEKGAAQVVSTATLEVTPKQAEKIAIAMQIGSLSLSLHSLALAQPEPEVDVLIRQANFTAADTAKPVHSAQPAEPAEPGSYTGEIDVLHMIGKPYGLPHPGRSGSGGGGGGVHVLRGSEAQQVKN
ncbi:MAG TPA: Flp pilus assembly protein CpaB [Rhodospirillales bacterium]|nr:Flp pilus assembly protein CpaB [Rhodospirillales bacterium]